MASRRFPKERSLRRRINICDPKFRIVVVCEGGKTEPIYLERFKNEHSNQLVDLIIVRAAGVPVTIVDKAIEERKRLMSEARRSKNSFDRKFQVWGVFDIDEHPNVAEAKLTANDNNIELAISNPCFELWPFLHLCAYDRPTDRHEMQKLLQTQMPKYCPKKGKLIDYDLITENYEEAKKRADILLKRRESEAIPQGNPSTNVYKLTDQIIINGKAKTDCQSQ